MKQEKKKVWSSEEAAVRGQARLARLNELSKLAGVSVSEDTKSLEEALADMEHKKTSLEQWKSDHAEEIVANKKRWQDSSDKLAALSQADRRKVLDAAGLHHVFAVSAPLEPVRGGGFYTPKPAPPPIDWPHWRLMPQVSLWEAVALSVNLNPTVLSFSSAGAAFERRMEIALSHFDSGMLPLVVHHPANRPVSRVDISEFSAWAAKLNFSDMPLELVAMAATEVAAMPSQNTAKLARPPVVAVGALVEPDKAGPVPIETRAMADSFAGLRWSGEQWIKKLGDKPVWLGACIVLHRGRGEGMRQWNPVLIGAYLVRMRHVKANSVRAKFQTQEALKPWLEEWKTYEYENFTTD